ncbi:hypothetical protein N9Z41_00910 [bacterium]|nr:hypothetical protein [bacterium]
MTIHIPIEQFNEKAKKLYLENKFKNIGIDYQPNSIVGWYENEEIEIFSFKKVFMWMDNRYTSYNLYQNKIEIILEITS